MSSLAHASLLRPFVLSLAPHPWWPSLKLWPAHSPSPPGSRTRAPDPTTLYEWGPLTIQKVGTFKSGRFLVSFVSCSLFVACRALCLNACAQPLISASASQNGFFPLCMTIAGGYFCRLAQRVLCSAHDIMMGLVPGDASYRLNA